MNTQPNEIKNSDKCFLLYGNCFAINGSRRSLILDIQNKKKYYIPNDLYSILIEYQGNTINEINSFFSFESINIINEYFDFLIEKNLIFFCETEELNYFPRISLVWDSPSIITNAIIEYDGSYDMENVLNQLNALGCYHIQFVFGKLLNNFKVVSDLFRNTQNSTFKSFEVIIKNANYDLDSLELFLKENIRVRNLIVYSSLKEEEISFDNEFIGKLIFTQKQFIVEELFIKPYEEFILNLDYVSEAKLHNTYYNRKLAVSKDGHIKNSLNQVEQYGNVQDNEIRVIVESKEFQKLWNLNKDEIEICKDCEHRYICFDGRIPFLKENVWKYSTVCNYNPYIAKWDKDDGYVTIEEKEINI